MAVGRPSGYDPDNHPRIAKAMALLGAVDIEIADALDIDVRTLYRWRATHEDFCQALSAGKEPSDERVERSLFMRAVGYSHPEDDIRVINNEIVVTPTVKHYPPDTKAALAWLYNRRPEKWHPQPQGDGPGDVADKIIEIIRATKPKADEADSD